MLTESKLRGLNKKLRNHHNNRRVYAGKDNLSLRSEKLYSAYRMAYQKGLSGWKHRSI